MPYPPHAGQYAGYGDMYAPYSYPGSFPLRYASSVGVPWGLQPPGLMGQQAGVPGMSYGPATLGGLPPPAVAVPPPVTRGADTPLVAAPAVASGGIPLAAASSVPPVVRQASSDSEGDEEESLSCDSDDVSSPPTDGLGDMSASSIRDVIQRVTLALGLTEEVATPAEGGPLSLGGLTSVKPPSDALRLPDAVHQKWASFGGVDSKWSAVPNRKLGQVLRVSEDDYDRLLKVPVMDKDVAKRLPGGGRSNPASYQPFWEEELKHVDAHLRSCVRLAAFQLIILNQIGGEVSGVHPKLFRQSSWLQLFHHNFFQSL